MYPNVVPFRSVLITGHGRGDPIRICQPFRSWIQKCENWKRGTPRPRGFLVSLVSIFADSKCLGRYSDWTEFFLIRFNDFYRQWLRFPLLPGKFCFVRVGSGWHIVRQMIAPENGLAQPAINRSMSLNASGPFSQCERSESMRVKTREDEVSFCSLWDVGEGGDSERLSSQSHLWLHSDLGHVRNRCPSSLIHLFFFARFLWTSRPFHPRMPSHEYTRRGSLFSAHVPPFGSYSTLERDKFGLWRRLRDLPISSTSVSCDISSDRHIWYSWVTWKSSQTGKMSWFAAGEKRGSGPSWGYNTANWRLYRDSETRFGCDCGVHEEIERRRKTFAESWTEINVSPGRAFYPRVDPNCSCTLPSRWS